MIGTVIQNKRKALGLTQAQLADLLGVSAPAVNRWEKNLCFPDAALLAPLARCLHTDLNGLFSFYDSLTDKERALLVDRASNMLLHSGEEEAIAYIAETLKENLSDGLLYQKMADLLFSFHVAAKASRPTAYLQEAAEYYERASELLSEKRGEMLSSLMSIYAQLGDHGKAEAAWKQLPEYAYSKKWLHAEMLFSLENYTASAEEAKSLILSDIVDLALHIDFLECTLSLAGDTELAEIAGQKATALRDLFDLWSGMETFSLVSKAISESNVEDEVEQLLSLIHSSKTGTRGNSLSACPLFKNVELGGKERQNATIADVITDLMKTLNKFS